jgi:hypothetical protein
MGRAARLTGAPFLSPRSAFLAPKAALGRPFPSLQRSAAPEPTRGPVRGVPFVPIAAPSSASRRPAGEGRAAPDTISAEGESS